MKLIADMHTHTTASGHAYSTVNELARAAARRGLAAIAVTDHGPALPGGPHLYHFGAMRFIPKELFGVRVICGVEANILDEGGDLDLPEHYLQQLDFVMAGFHEGCGFDNRGIEVNTRAVVSAMQNPLVKAISHPGNPAFPIDIEEVVEAAVATQTALEINNSSFTLSRHGSRPRCESIARALAASGAPVTIGSDAHIAQDVGSFDQALKVVAASGIREEQLVNADLERLRSFLGLATLK